VRGNRLILRKALGHAENACDRLSSYEVRGNRLILRAGARPR
jgi:hypothetical protein